MDRERENRAQRCFLCFAYCCHCIVNTSCHVETCGALYRVQKLAFFSVFVSSLEATEPQGKSKVFDMVRMCHRVAHFWVHYACLVTAEMFFFVSLPL